MADKNYSFNNLLNQNEEDSYYTYVSKNGIRKTENYYDTLAKSNTERILSSADYGARADYLASSGLNASGYEDYVKSQNQSRYNASLCSAEHEKRLSEYKNQHGYQDYLSDYEKLQTSISESVIKSIASKRNFSYTDALNEAVRAGVSKDLAYYTASAAVKKAKDNTVKEAIGFAKLNNLSAKDAKSYAVSLGLDERYSNMVYKELSTLSDAEKSFYAKMTADEYYEYVKSLIE